MQKLTKESAIVLGVGLKTESFLELKESLAELEELAIAAGADVVSQVTQVLEEYKAATLIGSGKIEEIKNLIEQTGATLVICDHRLSGSQSRNLEKELKVRVLDRSQIILDIFAQRAKSYEGKLQVELAQCMDQLPRMVGAWMGSHSRQGGGIGTRGPGETALELDRRRITERMSKIKKKLEDVRQHRQQHRAQRKRMQVPSFALIGYTNTGKSTLLNALTKSQVLVKDQVFATLDPTTRKVHFGQLVGPTPVPNGEEVQPSFSVQSTEAVITDTVGFIRKLPTHLIEAFKATLEESAEADFLVHVIDLSSPFVNQQIDVVDELIESFGWSHKPIIHVFNKIDATPMEKQFQVNKGSRVFVSAKTGQGLDRLKRMMAELAQSQKQPVELFFPRDEEHRIYDLSREGQIQKTENGSTGTVCVAEMTSSQLSRWREFVVRKQKD